ncbi:MAG: hypothetical protein BKP49_04065 [Treponema sp. CETP13]|nr:MAG: hypothetical protein BKP49_04065 [Treponema sp. CETP13]
MHKEDMTLIPSFLITTGFLFSAPKIQTRTYTSWESLSRPPITWSINENLFKWLQIDCGTITQGEILSRAKPSIRNFSDPLCFREPYTASYKLNYPSDANTEEQDIAFSTQFNIGSSALIFFTQLQENKSTELFPASSVVFSLPLRFHSQDLSFVTAIQKYQIDSSLETSWYTDFPIVKQESCTAISAETSYKKLFYSKTAYEPTCFQFYAGGTLAEQIDYKTKGLFRVEARFKSPFGGISAHLFSCDYGFMGSDAKPQTTTLDSSIQPQIQIPLLHQDKTGFEYIIINTTANLSIKPKTYYTNSFNNINSILASRMEPMNSFISFSGGIILNKKDQTFKLSAQIKDLKLAPDYKPTFISETTTSFSSSSEFKFAYFTFSPCASLEVESSSIFTILGQEYSLKFQTDFFEINANCIIADETLKGWEIATKVKNILGLTMSAQINQKKKLEISLKYIYQIIKKNTPCTAPNFPVKCVD